MKGINEYLDRAVRNLRSVSKSARNNTPVYNLYINTNNALQNLIQALATGEAPDILSDRMVKAMVITRLLAQDDKGVPSLKIVNDTVKDQKLVDLPEEELRFRLIRVCSEFSETLFQNIYTPGGMTSLYTDGVVLGKALCQKLDITMTGLSEIIRVEYRKS